MTLDEAIVHAREQAERLMGTACGAEHEQLARWLESLRQIEVLSEALSRSNRALQSRIASMEMENDRHVGERDAAEAKVKALEAATRGANLNDLREALDNAQSALCFSARDWSVSRGDAWLYGMLVGWSEASLKKELAPTHGWSDEDLQLLARLHGAVRRFRYLSSPAESVEEGDDAP